MIIKKLSTPAKTNEFCTVFWRLKTDSLKFLAFVYLIKMHNR